MISLQWHGPRPPGDPDEMDLLILKDIQRNLDCLEKPSDLITHTVFLGDGYDGPSVIVWGQDGDDDQFHCEYLEKTEWVSIDEIG